METTPAGNKSQKTILIILAVVVLASLAALFIIKNQRDAKAEKDVKEAVDQIGGSDIMTYKDVSVGLFGSDINISDVKLGLPGGEATVENITLSEIPTENIPESFSFSMDGFKVPVTEALFEDGYADLAAMGIDALDASLAFSFSQDKKAKTFDLDNLSISAKNMGSFSMNFTITNIDLDNAFMYMFDQSSLNLAKAEITYKDDSLLSRTLELAAKEEGKSVEETKQEVLDEIDAAIESAEQGGYPKAVAFYKEIREFVENPKSLTITFAPEQSVSLTKITMLSPEEAITSLNITASAN